MARNNKDSDFLKSALIIGEIKKYPVLYDTGHPSFAERTVKTQCWDDVCAAVFPNWSSMNASEKSVNGKDIQKRWRSIRDSYTKQYRAGKCPPPATLPAGGGRRLQHQRQMSFFYHTLAKKTPRPSVEKRLIELDNTLTLAPPVNIKEEPKIIANQIRLPSIDISEVHDQKTVLHVDTPNAKVKTPELEPKERRKRQNIEKSPDVEFVKETQNETCQKEVGQTKTQKHLELRQREANQREMELRKRVNKEAEPKQLKENQKEVEIKKIVDRKETTPNEEAKDTDVEFVEIIKIGTPEKIAHTNEESDRNKIEVRNKNSSLEFKIDSNTVLPEDHFDDDRLFMLSLLPFLKKMDDDMRLTCRIEVLKVIKYALQICGQKSKKNGEGVCIKEECKSSEERDIRNTSSSSQTSALRMCRKRKPEDMTEQTEQPTQRRRGRPRKQKEAPVDMAPACWLVYNADQKSQLREERARRRLLRTDHAHKQDESDSEDTVYSQGWRYKNRESRAQRARKRDETRAHHDDEEELNRATSVSQLRAENFLKMYNLEPTKKTASPPEEVIVKKELKDT